MSYGIGVFDFTDLTSRKRTSSLVRRQVPKGAVRRRAQDRAVVPVLVSHNGGATYRVVKVREGYLNGAKTAYCYAQVRRPETL